MISVNESRKAYKLLSKMDISLFEQLKGNLSLRLNMGILSDSENSTVMEM